MIVKIKDVEAYQKELKSDYIRKQELSMATLAGSAALKCGWFLALANATLITVKHTDFEMPLLSNEEAKSEEISEQWSPPIE